MEDSCERTNERLGYINGAGFLLASEEELCFVELISLVNVKLFLKSRESSVSISLDYVLDDLGFDYRRGLGIFLFTAASRKALGSTQPPIQWVPGALSLVIKRPGREADHSPPSSAEVRNAWSIPPVPSTSSWNGA
jgi:hypothetical protein